MMTRKRTNYLKCIHFSIGIRAHAHSPGSVRCTQSVPLGMPCRV